MKNISKYTLAMATVMLTACSNPLDKKFDRETAEADFARIVKLEKIDSTEAYIMSHFMVEHDLIGAQVLELNATYRDILQESQEFWNKSKNAPAKTKDAKENQKFDGIDIALQPASGSVQQSEWSHSIKYRISIQNNSGKAMKALKGNFSFYDPFGDRVQTVEYKFLDTIAVSEKVEREVTLRIQNTVSPQLILEYGKTMPFEIKWETTSVLFE